MCLNRISKETKELMLVSTAGGALITGGVFASVANLGCTFDKLFLSIITLNPAAYEKSNCEVLMPALYGAAVGVIMGATLSATVSLVKHVVSNCPIFWKTRTTEDKYGWKTTTHYFLGCIKTNSYTEPPKPTNALYKIIQYLRS